MQDLEEAATASRLQADKMTQDEVSQFADLVDEEQNKAYLENYRTYLYIRNKIVRMSWNSLPLCFYI